MWFKHEDNTRSDKKIRRLVARHGATGYGAFWMICEELYKEESHSLEVDDIEVLALELRIDEAVLKSVIFDFELFTIEDDLIQNKRVSIEAHSRERKSKKAKEAAEARWAKEAVKGDLDANAMQTHSERNANAYAREEKRREEKKREENIGAKANEEKPVQNTDQLYSKFVNDFFPCSRVTEDGRMKFARAVNEVGYETVLDGGARLKAWAIANGYLRKENNQWRQFYEPPEKWISRKGWEDEVQSVHATPSNNRKVGL